MDPLSRRGFLVGLVGALAPAPLLPRPLSGSSVSPDAGPTALFATSLEAALEESGDELTAEMVLSAARVAGMAIRREEAEEMVRFLSAHLERYEALHAEPLGNHVALPLHFDPRVPGVEVDRTAARPLRGRLEVTRPADLTEVALWSVPRLARLVETGQVTATELTELYLSRLERHNPTLNCVVTLTPGRAREQAARADREIAAGEYRGPLHGLPYGVKDIIAVRGYPTTWGAAPFRDQVVELDASVVRRLDDAGAILVAKLTTGELAFGDQWFGGRTNNPWDPEEGSSGSSAGSASATAAGLVAFAIGTDTGGSILSPADRCGLVGLRPTFGRVSRHGVMAAGTTLDKIGPMCRTAEGAALVLQATAGPDGYDFSVPEGVPVHWDPDLDVAGLRVGYHRSAFEAEPDEEYRAHHEEVAGVLRSLGVELRDVTLPETTLNFFVEFVERAAGFAEFIREGGAAELRRGIHGAELRAHHLSPAGEYLQANRMRQRLMEETHRAMQGLDMVLSPRTHWTAERSLNPLTSFTGHPVVSVPTGWNARGTPLGVTLTGHLYREGEILALAGRLMRETGFEEGALRLLAHYP